MDIIFFERKFPSANMILIKDELPILIDTGFGSDVKETEQLIKEAGVSPEELHLIVNTHYHKTMREAIFIFKKIMVLGLLLINGKRN
ncbi:MBL fold metallo-hydrolase [Cytobacillus firmus]|uniref:MBL fold metallo-hydrolase n=1 Tax=Cytobacillus firmus TaxID=1399 RepID=UPI0034A375C5